MTALIQTSLIAPPLMALIFRLLRYLPAELYPLALWRGLFPV